MVISQATIINSIA